MKKYLLVFLLFFSVNLLHAQKEEATYKYWMTIGFWIDRDVTANFNYNFSLDNNFYKVGYLTKGYSFPFGGFGSGNILIRSIDISIGRRLQFEWFQASLFAGPSYVFGKKLLITDSIEKFNTVGLETEIQLLFRPSNEVGIGIGLYGNINFIKNYVGININLTLGNGK